MSAVPDNDLDLWLATIEDDEEREAVASLFDLAGQMGYVEPGEEEYSPFVYPH